MIIGFILLILWVFNYPSGPPRLRVKKVNFCGAVVRSTCTDDFTTEWNSKNIGKNLKMWMNKMESIKQITTPELKYYYLSKSFYTEPKRMHKGEPQVIVNYIGNKNCATGKTTGPVWKVAALKPHARDQFHDGFLYDLEDDNGTFTGIICMYICVYA